MAQQARQVWVWCPADADVAGFRHPADVPADDEAAAKSCFVDNRRGLKAPVKIRQAQVVDTKGRTVLIAEEGATREVSSSSVLSWFEGLLLLQELREIQDRPEGWDSELAVLEKERVKFKDGQLAASLYVEKRLLTTAVTGKNFVDDEGVAHGYRRERMELDKEAAQDGEKDPGTGFFKISDVVGYLPPWEAFCHSKCGFYQDFYQVRWAHPFSEIDYSMIENGCGDIKGTTWEPDECLPASMDHFRISAKRDWIKKRREQEAALAERTRANKRAAPASEAESATPALKRLRSEDAESSRPPPELARTRRDGKPLERDVFCSTRGHDFLPPEKDKDLGEIRSGWPKSAEEYPKGYGVANPPGYCMAGCDCMDDQRPQRSWETTKLWIEDSTRSTATRKAVDDFSQQTRFLRRRGQVSNQCFFEALSSTPQDLPHPSAALRLAESVCTAIVLALKKIPLHSLKVESHPVCIPALAFVKESSDYEPLGCRGTLAGGAALPGWLRLDPDDARLFVEGVPDAGLADMNVSVSFMYAEGAVGPFSIGVTPERLGGPTAPWVAATGRIAARFNTLTGLHSSAAAVLKEHLSEVYDFGHGSPKDKALGEWLKVMIKLLRMLRSTAVANILVTSVHRAPPAVRAPTTPPR